MTPLKEALEVPSPIAESTNAQVSERPKAAAGKLRSDAVSLEVQVRVHGSRVTEVKRGTTPLTEPFEEQTSTMIVFPQGGVLRMSTAVAVGQMLVLTNLKSGHDAICRVLKVRAYAQTQSYVEVEFTNRQPGYWGVHFPSDAHGPAKPMASPAPPPAPIAPVAFSEKPENKPAPEISWAPAAALQPPAAKLPDPAVFSSPAQSASPLAGRVQQGASESTFAQIGSQEDVQPAASATFTKRNSPRSIAPAAPVSTPVRRADSQMAPPVHVPSSEGAPSEVTDLSEILGESSQEDTSAAFGRLAANASLSDAHTAPHKAFGARFDAGALAISDQASETVKESGNKWILVAAGVAALIVVGVVGALYFHPKAAGKAVPAVASAPVSAPSPEAAPINSSAQTTVAQAPNPNPVAQLAQPAVAPAASAPAVTTRTIEATPAKAGQPSAPARVPPSAPANQKAPSRLPDMSASLNAHPVSSARSVSVNAMPAPSVETSSPTPSGDLQGIAVSSVEAPPPAPAEPLARVRVGGTVQPPKLISSVSAVYPPMAKSAGVEGSVVIDVSIDPSGKVAATKVLSGPVMLREAAVDAVRRWKYQPGTLDGSPVAVHMTVTIQFHR
jgi:periplasmic protein TonB